MIYSFSLTAVKAALVLRVLVQEQPGMATVAKTMPGVQLTVMNRPNRSHRHGLTGQKKAALADFFKRQGMSEDEVTAALADFKAKKAAQQPNVTAVEKERDAALAQVEEMKNTNYLRDKGVKPDDLDYVLFKVSKQVDDKTDFKKAADAFLKENPRFTGQGMKVVSTGKPDGGSGTGQTVNDSINASIRSAFGR